MTSKDQLPTTGDNSPVELPPHLERLAWLMDQSIRVPGTNFKLGLDSIIGLIPGIGDFIGLVISAWIIFSSVQAGARQHVVVRMLGNVGKDALLGTVPVVGDLFDMASKANVKNIELLRKDLEAQRNQSRRAAFWHKAKLWLLALGVVAIITLALYGAAQLISKLL